MSVEDDTTEFDREELQELFEDAAREAIEEADYVTRDEMEEIVQRKLDKKNTASSSEDEDATAESVRDEKDDLLDELRDEGVPDDIVDAVSEYIAAEGVAKALDVEQVDPELARQLQENEAVLKEQIERAENRQEALAEAVAEGEPEVPVLDAVIYEEGE